MADNTLAPDQSVSTDDAPPRRDVKRMLLTVLRAGILIVTGVLIIVAIPYFYNTMHTAGVVGVKVRIDKSGDAIFTSVVSGTPAAQAGILVSDVLTAINGQAVPSGASIAQLAEQVSGWVYTSVTVTVRTGTLPPRTVAVLRTPEPGSVTARLATLGISFDFIVDFMIFMDCLVLVVYLAVASILILRGRNTPLLYFAVIALVTFGASATNSLQLLAHDVSPLGWIAAVYVATGFAASFTFLGFLYPDGKWVTRRGRILVAIVWIWTVVQWVWPAARPANWDYLIFIFVYVVMIIVMFNAQVHRYRRVATPAQRQQIKWFVLAMATVVAGYVLSQIATVVIIIMSLLPAWASPVTALILWQVGVLGYQVPYALLAVAIGVALLRYRLWDIDVVINQSLVYSALTASLAVVFAVVLALVNSFVNQTVGSASPLLVVAITTAFPVALFNPLKGRIQKLVDGRLKPEEVGFTELCALLALEVQALLPARELFITLARAVAGQLDLTSVAAYAFATDGRLIPMVSSDINLLPPELTLSEKTREELENGDLATPPEESGLAYLVPLTTISVYAPGLCGVLALGPRKNGKGFTTPMENGLRVLGREAGKSLYVAQRRESAEKIT